MKRTRGSLVQQETFLSRQLICPEEDENMRACLFPGRARALRVSDDQPNRIETKALLL